MGANPTGFQSFVSMELRQENDARPARDRDKRVSHAS